MNKSPIYIVDDDVDDEQLIKEAFKDLGIKNDLKFFHTGQEVLDRLKKTDEVPFLIISDVNLPKMDGFVLRQKILEESGISHKTVPFIFWSTNASQEQVKRAYDLSAHGFFLKAHKYSDLKEKIREMVSYWSDSLAPKDESKK